MAVSSNQINEQLLRRFGLSVDFSMPAEDLLDVLRLYEDRCKSIALREGGGAAMQTSDYAKAYLITEAVRVFLREIAPRRMNKKKRNQK